MAKPFLAECRKQARDPDNRDQLQPLSAAARLMNSTARVAQALGPMALVERRQRTIVERIQPPKPELNSKIEAPPEESRSDKRERINRHLAEIEARERREQLLHPIDPQEEANLMLQEELAGEDMERRGQKIGREIGQTLGDPRSWGP